MRRGDSEDRCNPRLLVLASTYPRWAGDHEPGFVHELSKRLTANFDVVVISPHAPGSRVSEDLDGVEVRRFRYAPTRFETLVNNGGIVTNLRKHRWKWLLLPLFFAGLCWSTFQAIRKFRPHVIHAHWLIPQGVVLLLLRCLGVKVPPYLVTSHGADLFALRAKPLTWLKRQVALHAGSVSVVSRVMKEELALLGVPKGSIQVRSMGVDLLNRFTPIDVKAAECKCQILFVGRLVEKKGARYLIEALPDVAKEFPSLVVRIVGHGPELTALKEMAVELGVQDYVDFMGSKSQEEVAALGQNSTVFVAPFVEAKGGDQEGLGLVLVEALGVGCPVVVSDVSAIKDVVENTEGVCVVPQRSAKELMRGIVQVLQSPERYRHGVLQSRERLIERFDWNSVAESYANMLSQLLVRH